MKPPGTLHERRTLSVGPQVRLDNVGHVHALDGPTAYRGCLMVESKRRVHRRGDLTEEEAAAIGRTTNQMARLLHDAMQTVEGQ